MKSILLKAWGLIKYALIIGLILLIALIGLGWYMSKSKGTAQHKTSPFIQQLDQAEKTNGDVLKLLVDGIKSASAEDTNLIVDWLSQRQSSGEQPYLYLLALYHGKLSDPKRQFLGVMYYAQGALEYRVDAAKCGDPTANQAVQIMEGAFGLSAIREALKAKPEVHQNVIKKTLENEQMRKNRAIPEWVCRHGLHNRSPAPSEQEFEAQRQTVRTQFEASF